MVVLLLVIGHLAVATFPCAIPFVIIGTRILFLTYIMVVFIEFPHLVAVFTFWYTLRFICTLSRATIPKFVPLFHASRTDTLILGFMLRNFSSSLELFVYICTFVWMNFIDSMSHILLIVIVLMLPSSPPSITATMFLYDLSKFYRMCIIIYVSYIYVR